MEDKGKEPNSPNQTSEKHEPIRSRWTPKPEQILILESIFNSGMVNPPKNETIRIRKLLEKFGSVGDANVFYWFQNRRSRTRRKQRQMQANLAGNQIQANGAIQFDTNNSNMCFAQPESSYLVGSCSGGNVADAGAGENVFSFSGQMSFPGMDQIAGVESILGHPNNLNLQYQSDMITVFINGVATEVAKGAIDMKSMFGEDAVLLHSSGIPLPVNEFGFSLQSLQHGETYFVVSTK